MAKRKIEQVQSGGGGGAWEAPSSFNKLMKSLKRSTKRQGGSTLLAVKRAVQAQEEQVDDDEPVVHVKPGKKIGKDQVALFIPSDEETGEGDDEEDGSEEEGEGGDVVAKDPLQEDGGDDSEQEEVTPEAIGTLDDEDATGTASKDPWERHFGDHISASIPSLTGLVDSRKWEAAGYQDEILQTVVEYHLPKASCPPAPIPPTLETYLVKQRLRDSWLTLNNNTKQSTKCTPTNPFTPLQAALFRHMNNYQDILHTQQTHATTLEIRRLYCLHAVNHVLKTRDRVLKNSAKLKAAGEDGGGEEWRDQGFTRPKVLILAPFKNNALEIVNLLIELSGSTQQDNKKRFMDEFGIPEEEDVLDPKKPADHQKTFAGNIDDCFRIGIKFARRQMKLFAPFYSSDVIVASPLGLRMVIGAEGDKKRDYDFLSAIEVVILDQTDVFLMQNWDHVSHIFDHLNQIPKDAHGCDFSRVRAYYLDSNAKYLRQTLLFSSLNSPDLNSLFAKSCKNTAGKIKTLSPHTGTLSNVLVPVPQLFQRIPCSNPAKADDARFAYFVERVLPTLRSSIVQQAHSMIFIPTYFDYVRVRNYLKEHKYEFAELSEYTPTRDISRARGDFFHGKISYVLTTERFHFFRRYHIRGIRHLVFYGLPEYPHFYSEMLNMMDHTAAGEVGVTALFTQYDRIKVERIVGTRRVAKLTDGQKDAIMFT